MFMFRLQLNLSILLLCLVITWHAHPLALPQSDIQSGQNESDASDVLRRPIFKENVKQGIDIAVSTLRAESPVELVTVNNRLLQSSQERRIFQSSNLDDFTRIDMELLELTDQSPLAYQRFHIKGDHMWGRWDPTLRDPFIVDDSTVERKFTYGQIIFDEARARHLLVQNGIRGPWTFIQLCKRNPGADLTYAFRRVSTPARPATWDLVNVRTNEVSEFVGRDDYCPPAKIRASETANGTASGTGSTMDQSSVTSFAPLATDVATS